LLVVEVVVEAMTPVEVEPVEWLRAALTPLSVVNLSRLDLEVSVVSMGPPVHRVVTAPFSE